jgi:isoleucyl-tRNA synthetase
MAQVRRLVELGRAARAEAKVKTRQPLSTALISAPGWSEMPEALRREVADELNVGELSTLAGTGELVQLSVKPNFRALGKRFSKRTQVVASAITSADPATFVAALRAGQARVIVDGADVEIEPDEVAVTETPRSGWAVASGGAETVALDLELTHELRLAGLARDVIRVIQEARKSAGLDVTDRIEVWWRVGGSPEPAEAVRAHSVELAAEVLAVELHESAPTDTQGMYSTADDDLGLHIWLRRVR